MNRSAHLLTFFLLPLFLFACGRFESNDAPTSPEPYSTTAPKLFIPGPTETPLPQPTLQPTPTLKAQAEPTATEEVAVPATAVPEPTEAVPLLALSVPAANVRSGPGIEYAITGVVSRGETTPVIGVSDDGGWINIALPDGGEGWVGGSVATIVQP